MNLAEATLVAARTVAAAHCAEGGFDSGSAERPPTLLAAAVALWPTSHKEPAMNCSNCAYCTRYRSCQSWKPLHNLSVYLSIRLYIC